MDMKQVYSTIVMENARHSDYKHPMEEADIVEDGHNPSCGDEIQLSLRMEGDRIKEAAFTGHGCAISQASTSLMCQLIEGETVETALEKVDDFLAMIKGEKTDEEELADSIGDAVALKDISHMPQRVKCAELAWRTLQDIFQQQ